MSAALQPKETPNMVALSAVAIFCHGNPGLVQTLRTLQKSTQKKRRGMWFIPMFFLRPTVRR
jgi:hypothetical protein